MSLDALIMLAGVFVGILPQLGFPPNWNSVILFILGVFIFAFGIIVRRRGLGVSPRRPHSYTSVAREPFAPQTLDDGEAA